MQQYIYEDEYRGKSRKLLILFSAESREYRVFCESQFLGLIKSDLGINDGISWKTDYNILKPIVGKIGSYIESCEI